MNHELAIIAGLFGGDRGIIPYRAKIAKIIGITGAILLQQIVYWWEISDHKPFYKFKQKCTHKLYREGDSWCEELAFTRREFDNAIARIGTRKTSKITMADAIQEGKPVIYWTDRGRVTHYTVNPTALLKMLEAAYPLKYENASSKSTKAPLAKVGNELLLEAESADRNTETTTDQPEITTEDPPPDFLEAVFNHTQKKTNARPKGWSHVDPPAWEICQLVAEQFPCKLPVVKPGHNGHTKEMIRGTIDKWTGGATLLLEAFDGDAQAARDAITAFRAEYDGGFTVAGPQSLVNAVPSFAARSKGKPRKRRAGHRPVGRWTETELEAARQESLMEPHLDPKTFFDE
jgi:hypothetical protein